MAYTSAESVRVQGVERMEQRGQELLDLLLNLAGLDQQQFAIELDKAIKDGFVSKTEFERFVTVMHERYESSQKLTKDRLDGQEELIKLKVENVELKLRESNRDGFDRYIEDQLPAAVARLHRDQRGKVVHFVRSRAMMIVAIILTFSTAISLYAAIQSAAEVRDLKSIAQAANQINDALDP